MWSGKCSPLQGDLMQSSRLHDGCGCLFVERSIEPWAMFSFIRIARTQQDVRIDSIEHYRGVGLSDTARKRRHPEPTPTVRAETK